MGRSKIAISGKNSNILSENFQEFPKAWESEEMVGGEVWGVSSMRENFLPSSFHKLTIFKPLKIGIIGNGALPGIDHCV
jgi:hypothetical protein